MDAGEDFLWEKVSFLLSGQLKEVTSDQVLFVQKHILYGCLNYGAKDEETKGRYGSFYAGERPVDLTKTRKAALLTERPDKAMLFPEMSYSDNLLFTIDHRVPYVRRMRGVVKSARQELSGILGKEAFNKRIPELTQWERIQLVYARVILQKPEIVFCIQPFKGADLSTRLLIWELQELLLKKGITVVVLTLNMADALSLADRVIEIVEHSQVTQTLRRDFGSLSEDIPWSRLFR
ncbi:MAG: hypothetical protein IJ073_00435 [Lachnospiraceae bacterium]|nr:hypothetical protein [Lachnospiraceae bacterium]